ncbi:hypothetical protein BDV18DRAFT_135022 [Aspergillus unguis]
MSSQRYERVNAHDDDDAPPSIALQPTPSSPPPSFRSRSRSASHSSRHLLRDDPLHRNSTDQTLADAFDDSDSEAGEDEPDDRQRLMRAQPSAIETNNTSTGETVGAASSSGANTGAPTESNAAPPRGIQRSLTSLPFFGGTSSSNANRHISSNDGVFANLAAKPERGEKSEDLPPSYEEAAADATPPYWETTIVAPGISSDEVYVDGLPVGSIFSFIWNAMISMSFQLVGFLLTYLLHTTHAAKNGSRAGLGLTLVQYGFYMKGGSESSSGGGDEHITPPDPNSHNFDPSQVADGASSGGDGGGGASSISTSEWISYVLMIVGWFVLIRAISDFLRARRHEQLVLQSPERGLPVPIIAENERSETVV